MNINETPREGSLHWHLDLARQEGRVLIVDVCSQEEKEDWKKEVANEPCFVALKNLVERTGIWTGTEKQLMNELKLRVDDETWASRYFPKDLRTLMDYQTLAYFPLSEAGLGVLDYRELKKKEIEEEFDLPGWGPEAPILVERNEAARRPSYPVAIVELVLQQRCPSPLTLALLRFTYHSNKFTRKKRWWSGSTMELAEWLYVYYPIFGNDNTYLRDPFQASGKGHFDRYDETRKMLELLSPADYRRFYGQMKACANTVEEVGIKLSRKTSRRYGSASGKSGTKIRWTIEAPYWRD